MRSGSEITVPNVVNSSENTVANGSTVTASAQAYWPMKCVVLRAR